MLRATQYLPSILQLQQYLLSIYNHRKNHEELKGITIASVVREAPNGNDDFKLLSLADNFHLHAIYQTDRIQQLPNMIVSVRKAWDLVKGKIQTHGKL